MNSVLSRVVTVAVILALSSTGVPLIAQQPTSQESNASSNLSVPELPDSPGAVNASNNNQAPAAAKPSQATAAQAQAGQPSGTAVAPAVQLSGGAASKPAGVAIAPPKQRQVRSWLIRFGFIAGAGAALGTVAVLSAGSPGRVPGSH